MNVISLQAQTNTDKRFAVIGSKKVTKQARVEATVLNSLTPISKADIADLLPDISTTTIEAVLAKLIKEGKILKIGNFKDAKYIKK